MRPLVYLLVLVLLVPLQAGLLAPLLSFGIRPDLGLAVLYTIGLLTGPVEGALAGMAVGLVQDMASASLLGTAGLAQGIIGLLVGLLGRRVLDIGSPSNILFLAFFSLAGSLVIAFLMDMTYGQVPWASLLFRRMLPGAVATAIAGYLVLRAATRRDVLKFILRRDLQKEL